jgi:hypothetical protein
VDFGKKDKGGLSSTIALMVGKGPKPKSDPTESETTLDNEPDDDEDDTDDAHSAAFDVFASAVGIPEERKASAMSALKQFVQSCTRDYGDKEV